MLKWMKPIVAAALAAAIAIPAASAEVVYNRGANGDPQSLDPHKTSTVEEANILRDMFSGLVAQDADANLIPGAAASWTVSDTGLVYTFKLRDHTWSDGTPVSANDFLFSLRRVVDPKTASEYAYIAEPIVNAKEITAGGKKPEELGVKAIDDKTLEITLKGPTPYFLEMLTHQATYGVSQANVEKFGDDFVKPGNLVSNGAFTLAEFVPNDHIKIVKNPKFFDAANVKLDVVNYIPAEDRAAAMKRFEAGEIDSNNDFPTEQLGDLKTKFGDQLQTGPQLATYYYVFKTVKKPWDDVKLRHAISMVIDRDYLAEKVWQNAMLPAYGMVPPGVAGYTPKTASYAGMSQLDREDEAKKVFAELGITAEKPLKLELRYNTSENHKNTAVAVQDMLKAFNIEVTLINADGKTHYSHLEQKGDFDVARAGWIADYKDPGTFLDLGKTGTGNNYGEYSNAAYDDLLGKAAIESDTGKRMTFLSDAEGILMQDLGIMPLLFYANHNIVSPKLKGFNDNVMDVHPSRFISKD
jgi:oligopeptide transport system substrate-binding protein